MTSPHDPHDPDGRRDDARPDAPSGEPAEEHPRPWSYEDRPAEDRAPDDRAPEDRPEEEHPPRGPEHHHAGQPPYYRVPQTSGVDRPRQRPMHVGRMGSPWYSGWLLLIPAGALLLMFVVFLIFALG